MKKVLFFLSVCAAILLQVSTITAQPKIHQFKFSDAAVVQKLSNNGLWGIAQACMDESVESGQARLIDLTTDESIALQTQDDVISYGACLAKDVTDDGNIVVGQYRNQPAYWLKSTRQWTILPTPSGCSGGTVLSVTPDGKFAVGSCSYVLDEYQERGTMWNLMTGQIVELANVPVKDMTHETQNQMRFTDISPDGRYIVMYMSFSYVQPASICVWIYDRNTQTPTAIGFTPSDTEAWKPVMEKLNFVENPTMSPNGKWVSVMTRIINSDNTADAEAPGRYNIETGTLEIYTERESEGMFTTAIDNNGYVYGATPSGNPLRNWNVRYDNYWFDIHNILTQHYAYDIYAKTGFENSGTVFSVSEDGKRLAVICDPQYGEGYVLDLPQALPELCKDINLLGSYSISPASGSTFTTIRSVSILFDRNVEVVGNAGDIMLKNITDGTDVRTASGLQVDATDPQKIVITFRTETLEAGKKYGIEIPAGAICVKGDKNRTNDVIKMEYTGRANEPVAVTNIYPADGSELARIDNATSPVLITFNSEIITSEAAEAELINLSDNSKTPLNLLASGNRVAVFPASQQHLYKGLPYKIIIKAGAVTDVTGNGGSAEIVINYTGTYEPVISQDDENVFIETFDDMATSITHLMRYEGDHNTPTDDMVAWKFDADNQPWNFSIRETNTSTNIAAGSTSMYDPAGKSDDWMVTPQLFLPDKFCYLSFKAQSYRMRKSDYLKVLVWESDSSVYTLNANAIAKIKNEATVVFNQKLSPGMSEEEIDNDWTDYRVDLPQYGGKNIYIAFLNDNENQSAIFVDSIVVKRNMKFLVALTTVESVVNKESIEIKGRVTANDDAATFSSVTVELYDSEGTKVDEVNATGLSLNKGARYDFAFTKPLPLTVGVANEFKLKTTLDGNTSEAKYSIKNLAFNPTKRVVLEEVTGTTCINCPQGILAIENLEKLYHDQFIPISLHTYTGDALNTGQDDYAAFLGLAAAPSGIVQRNGYISYPMGTDRQTFATTFTNGNTLWADLVAAELQKPADAEINATVTIDEAAQTYSVPVSVKYALNAKNLNLNLFLVILEDGIISYQTNAFGSSTEAIFGEWGKGGRYSASTNYNVTHNDVVRSSMNTYNGFGGHLPQTVEAGTEYTATLGAYDIPGVINNINKTKAVVMLIDANDGRLINAACAKFPGYANAIDEVQSDAATHAIGYANGRLTVIGEGAATVQVYSISGALLGSATGNGSFDMPISGYNGSAIVKVTGNGTTLVKKLMINK